MSSVDPQASAPWMVGNIGPLKSGHVLKVTLKRPENTFYVSPDYEILQEEAIEIFEAFLGLRMKFLKHKYAHTPVVPSIKDEPEFHMISKEDVHRVAMFICDPKVVDLQTNEFISKFFKPGHDRLDVAQFLQVLKLECERRKLTQWECFFLLFEDPSSSVLSYIVAVIIMVLIIISSVCFVLSTDPSFQVESKNPNLPPEPHPAFVVIEIICIYCFLVEYLSRIVVVWAVRKGVVGSGTQKFAIMECFPRSELNSPRRKSSGGIHITDTPLQGMACCKRGIERTITYIISPMNLIDLIAILPFFVGMLVGGGDDLSSLRILRLARVMRIFKLAKKNEGINMLSTTMAMSRGSLNLLLFFGIIGTVVSGALIYFTESGTWYNPEECEKALPDLDVCSQGMFLRIDKFGLGKELTPFSSIPRTFWWVVVTATTVGYGDMYPTTALGKLVATFAMVSGLLVIALPISIIGTNFLVCFEKLDERNRRIKALEELELKMKVEEREAALEAESSLMKKQRDALARMPWRRKGGINVKPPKVENVSFKFHKTKLSAAALAASWSVNKNSSKSAELASPLGKEDRQIVFSDSPDSGRGASGDSVNNASNTSFVSAARGIKLRGKRLAAHKLNKHRLALKKSMDGGHQSLVGLKAKARLVPSFLFDTHIALNPPANLVFVNVERKSNIVALSLAGFGKPHHRLSNHMSDVALAVKYKPLLDKAQDVLQCIQV